MRQSAVRDLVVDLARDLRACVMPLLGSQAARRHLRAGASGDVTFEIDARAERRLEEFVAARAPGVAYYSEDRGLVSPAGDGDGDEWVLVVDPVDGTRPAIAGFESCCVSVAAASAENGPPTIADTRIGCVIEIKGGAEFVAERGAGLHARTAAGAPIPAALSANTRLDRMLWTLGLRGRPARPLMQALGDLVDVSSVGGAVFDLGSAAYDLTRLATGQLDAYADVGTRMIEEVPALRARFEQVGGGAVLNNCPYDIAAAVLCLEEAGAVVTDAHGGPLGPRPLTGSGHEYQVSCLAAANAELHARLLAAVDEGMARLRACAPSVLE